MKAAPRPPRKGSRHPLLMYRRTMDRVWKYTLALGLILTAATWPPLLRETEILGISSRTWILITALISFFVMGFAFFARYFAYAQARENALLLATPFLRLKISYRRIRSLHPVLIQQLFPPGDSNWAQRSYLEPFYGLTALVVELHSYPINPILLRLFLPKSMFYPRTAGLVLMVKDWMKLSTEFDSLRGAWLQSQGARQRASRTQR